MRIIVCGGRDFTDCDIVEDVLDRLHEDERITQLIHGSARGADTLAGAWARDRSIPVTPMPANWKKYGKKAGPIRNREMLNQSPDMVVAFPGGRGTADMVEQARRAGVKVLEVQLCMGHVLFHYTEGGALH